MPRTREQLQEAADAAERWLDSLDPAAIASPDTDASRLRRVGDAVRNVARSHVELADAVTEAREHGHTWTQIAAMLGTSRQAARERYGELAEFRERSVRGFAATEMMAPLAPSPEGAGRGTVMADKKNIHTVPTEDGWANRREDGKRASSTHDTKAEAQAAGRAAAKKDGVEHLIHKKDGTIGDRNSYGNDPHPPKG